MIQALLFLALIFSSAAVASAQGVTYTRSGGTLYLMVNGNSARDINISGTRTGGGTVTVASQSPNYSIPANIYTIIIYIHPDNIETSEGLDVDYVNYTSDDSYKLEVHGSNHPDSTDTVRTGRNHDYLDLKGGVNYAATGKGGDTIHCAGLSYIFSGYDGYFGNIYNSDWLFWDGYVVLYQAANPPTSYSDGIWPEEAGPGEGITVLDSGPIEGWN